MYDQRRGRFSLILIAITSLGAALGFAAAPTITSFTPTSGKLSTNVTITGTNFTSPATVSFSGVASSLVSVSSSTKLVARVPTTVGTGKITVQTAGGSVTSTSSFTVVPGVTFASAIGSPGTTHTLYFSGFGATEAADVYFDNTDVGLTATSSVGAGTLIITVPTTALPGSHWVTVVGRHSGLAAQIAFTVQTDWAQFGFLPTHPGGNPYENVLLTSSVDQLEEAWRTPDITPVYSSPAVAGGVIYASFSDGTVRAFDEATGTKKWTTATGGTTMYSSPAVANGVVYVGSSDKYLYALNATTGAVKWRHATGDVVYGSPTVSNGIVYFGSYDQRVYALNATTGSLVWSYLTGGPVFSSPAVSGDVVYFGSFDNNVYALNATTGALIWENATTAGILASPVLVGKLVCIGSEDDKMYAFHASTGAVAWTYTTGGVIDSTVAVIGTTLFVGGGDGKVYSLTVAGSLRWSSTALSGGLIYAPICAAGGVVYATDGSYTYAFSPSDGEILTALPTGSSYGGPVVVDGGLLGGDVADGVLARYTLNAAQAGFVAPRPNVLQLHPIRLQ